MAAGTFKIFNHAKHKLCTAKINLSAGPFRLALFTSASRLQGTATALPLSTYASCSGEVASAVGYVPGGETLSTPTFTTTSAKLWKFDASDHVFTAVTSAIADIKYAAIYLSAASAGGRHLLTYVTLTGTKFTLAINNTLTIQFPAGGIFTLL